MRINCRITALLFVLGIWNSLVSAIAEDFKQISEERLRTHIAYLAGPELKGRGNLSDRRKAADYLQTEYKKLGLKPLFPADSFRQQIPAPGLPGMETPLLGENVGAYLPGTDPALADEFILLTAHYDHLGGDSKRFFPGADDNAAAVAMVLEVARVLSQTESPPRRSIAFVNFDLEENLLWGSRWFVEHSPRSLNKIRLFMTADLIGRNLADLDWSGLIVMGGERGTGLPKLISEMTVPPGLEIRILGADIVGTRSDYGPFRDREIPFLFFSCGQHPDYHTPRDIPERVNLPKLTLISRYVGKLALQTAQQPDFPAWVEKPEPDPQEVETILRICELLSTDSVSQRLKPSDRLFVTRLEQQLQKNKAQSAYSKKERAEVVNSARQLLWILFSL